MQIKIFKIPADDDGAMQEEMNSFLRGRKVLGMQQELVANNEGIFWCFCVRYIERGFVAGQKGRVDYKAILSEEAFEKFSRLRQCRKEIADALNEKIYMVFTNEELSKMTELEDLTVESVGTIKGIGEKKLKKYVKPILEKYHALVKNEASR